MHGGEIGVFGGGVALRKESVDRNYPRLSGGFGDRKVALRKESVDRNFGGSTACCAVGR